MTNAYDAWKAAKAALAGREIAEGLRSALELSVAALREPAKIARVSELLRAYDAVQEAGPYDPADTVWAQRDSAAAEIAAALAEFESDAPILTDQRQEIADHVDNALRAMKHLNYTGEHTHFEVLDDVRTVLAEVLQGRAIPLLERFRCPSIAHLQGVGQKRCSLQLPHDGLHRAVTHDTAAGTPVWKSWTDEESDNPPKSYDEPEPALVDKIGVREDGTGAHCGVLATVDGKTVACMEPVFSEHSVHRSAGGRLYRIRPTFIAEGGV